MIGAALNNLGTDYYAQGDLAQAMRFYERSLEVKKDLKEEGASVAHTLNNLGLIYAAQKDFPKAIELHRGKPSHQKASRGGRPKHNGQPNQFR